MFSLYFTIKNLMRQMMKVQKYQSVSNESNKKSTLKICDIIIKMSSYKKCLYAFQNSNTTLKKIVGC